MRGDFNPLNQESYIFYFDINNQYGAAMSEFLPYQNFKWVHDFSTINIFNIQDDSTIGYILEVDFEYPEELHNLHKDLPLYPQHIIPPASKCKIPKLMTTLHNKQKYILHYRNLKQHLSLGMKLNNIHRVLQFEQKLWLKSYIDLNTEIKKKS